MKPLHFAVTTGFLFAIAAAAQAAEPAAVSQTGYGRSGDDSILVRVIRLHGTGPDGREYTLFSDKAGRLVPLTDMKGLGRAVDIKPLARGAYYDLTADLSNELHVRGPDGKQVSTTFHPEGNGPEVALSGVVVVTGKQVDAVGVMPRYIAAARSAELSRHAWHDDDLDERDDD